MVAPIEKTGATIYIRALNNASFRSRGRPFALLRAGSWPRPSASGTMPTTEVIQQSLYSCGS